jgi:hypothetical protein
MTVSNKCAVKSTQMVLKGAFPLGDNDGYSYNGNGSGNNRNGGNGVGNGGGGGGSGGVVAGGSDRHVTLTAEAYCSGPVVVVNASITRHLLAIQQVG